MKYLFRVIIFIPLVLYTSFYVGFIIFMIKNPDDEDVEELTIEDFE